MRTTNDKKTALMLAAFHNRESCVDTLINHRLAVSFAGRVRACLYVHTRIDLISFYFLLFVHQVDQNLKTALHLAAQQGNTKFVKSYRCC